MALSKNVNSYVTVAEANTYFEDRLDTAAWSAASDTQKAQALVTATSELDAKDWAGYAVSESQPLAFPRVLSYFDPRLGTTITLTEAVPQRILNATFELGYHLLNNDGLLDNTGDVEDLVVGSISLKNVRAPSKLSPTVINLISPLLVRAGAQTWWRAN